METRLAACSDSLIDGPDGSSTCYALSTEPLRSTCIYHAGNAVWLTRSLLDVVVGDTMTPRNAGLLPIIAELALVRLLEAELEAGHELRAAQAELEALD